MILCSSFERCRHTLLLPNVMPSQSHSRVCDIDRQKEVGKGGGEGIGVEGKGCGGGGGVSMAGAAKSISFVATKVLSRPT